MRVSSPLFVDLTGFTQALVMCIIVGDALLVSQLSGWREFFPYYLNVLGYSLVCSILLVLSFHSSDKASLHSLQVGGCLF